MNEETIQYAQMRLEKINSRILLAGKNLETYKRIVAEEEARKAELFDNKRKVMEKERCSTHQIEIAMNYAASIYKEDPRHIQHKEALQAYEKELKDLEMEKEIIQVYLNQAE